MNALFRARIVTSLTAAMVSLILLPGCATDPATSKTAWEPNRHTKPVVTPFWIQFPPKAEDLWVMPNATLPRNTPLRLLGNRRGFSYVQMDTLERGWVPRGTLGR
ncbi:MAG: hypothetical protein KDN19_06635 [Verrucomicrobiae bacterium]|nr:hypothetical protein [Verrucomicrobiae bacterium]